MKKLITLLTLFFILFVGTTYLYYTNWRSQQQRTATIPYIPASAALAYEVTDFNKQWKQFHETSIGQALSTLPPFTAIHQAMTWLQEELHVDPQNLDKVPLVLSLHQSPEGSPGCLLYFNTHDTATRDFWATIISKVQQDKDYHVTTKKYANRKITSWRKEGTKRQFAYVHHKQHVMASFSLSLIEELANALAGNQTASLLRLHKSDNAHGSLYINPKRLPQFIHTLVHPDQAKELSDVIATLAQDSRLNLQFTPHHVLFKGVTTTSNSQHLFHTLAGQTPRPIALTAYLPQRTTALQHVTFSHADQFLEAWQQHRGLAGVLNQGSDDLLTATLLPLLQGEIAHCTLPVRQGRTAGELVFMKVTDAQAFVSILKSAKALTPAPSAQTYRVTSDCFQSGLPGLIFPFFKASYLTHVDDYVLLANRSEALKAWRVQYQQKKTWAQSAKKHAWLASILDQAHLTWFVDLQQIWPVLLKSLQTPWREILQNHAAPFVDASLQLLRDPTGDCYASILLKHKEESQPRTHQALPVSIPPRATSATAKNLPGKILFQATNPLSHAPWLVKSHRGKGYYVLLQDTQYQLYLLDPTGKLLWKKALEGPITTQMWEIDFYKNSKTQYLFATDQKLHLVDYYGREVGSYPQRLPASAQLQLIDYNRDKNYRFLLATAQGDVYLKDKNYKSLPGWNPRKLGHAFTHAPFHTRLQGRDRFLALQTNDTLQALNRRGKSYPGFPVSLKAPVHNPLIVRKTAAGTVLTVVADKGKQFDFNLAGKLQKSVQLDHNDRTVRFIVCRNQALGDQYAIVRQDTDKVVMMDVAGKPLFEVPYTKEKLLVQYYSFGQGKQFYALTSPEEQHAKLYDFKGKEIAMIPSKNGHGLRLVFSKTRHQLEIYSGNGAQCVRYVLGL